MKSANVLFVCLGNICRSPTAEAVFRSKLDNHKWLSERVQIDSAGTGDWHIGSAPDPRSQTVGKQRGYDLSSLRARQVSIDDFYQYDYILAMDEQNLTNLKALKPTDSQPSLSLFLRYADLPKGEVPDPYYSAGDQGFHEVIDLIEAASEGLLKELEQKLA